MLRQGRIVLLFDGFDELVTRLTYDRAADHLEHAAQAAEGKAKIVVASRTQHFRTRRAGVHRARRAGGAAAAPAGAQPSRTSPRRRSTPTSSTATAATSEAADARFRLLRGIERPARAGPEPADARLHRRSRLSGWRPPSRRPAHHQRGRAVPGDPGLLAGLRGADGRRAAPGRRARPRHPELWGAVTTLALRAVGEPARRTCGPHELVEVADTLTGLTAEHAVRPADARTPWAAAACWCAPRRGCSGSSTPR